MIIDRSLLYVGNNSSVQEASDNLFEYSLECLIESNNDIISRLEKEAYVVEAWGDKRFKVFNFYGILDAIVGAFITLIEKLIGRFLALLVTLAGQGQSFNLEARAFKKSIEEYKGGFVLSDIYKFSNLESGKFPNMRLKNYFSDTLNKYISDFNDAVESSKDANTAVNKLKFTNELDIQDAVNRFRYDILEKNYDSSIMSDEMFAKECFKVFRSDMELPVDRYYFKGPEVYNNFYKPYMDSHKLRAEAKRDSKRIQDNCKDAKKELKRFTPDISKYYDQDYSNILNAYNTIQRNVCILFDKECRDVVTLYGAKLQAYKDQYKQARRVIMKCMQEIAKEIPFRNKEEGEW